MGCETPGRTMPAAERLALDSVILEQWLRFYWLEETEDGHGTVRIYDFEYKKAVDCVSEFD